MEVSIVKVQSYDGGKEHTFPYRAPYMIRARLALTQDKQFQKMSAGDKNILISYAVSILSAIKAGLGDELCVPAEVTVDSCLAFAEGYAIELVDGHITEDGVDVDENPTDTKGEVS